MSATAATRARVRCHLLPSRSPLEVGDSRTMQPGAMLRFRRRAVAALHEFLDGGSVTQLSSVLGLTHSEPLLRACQSLSIQRPDQPRHASSPRVFHAAIAVTQR
jgi:hypothetical protein